MEKYAGWDRCNDRYRSCTLAPSLHAQFLAHINISHVTFPFNTITQNMNKACHSNNNNIHIGIGIISGVLLKMEVGIRKRAWRMA